MTDESFSDARSPLISAKTGSVTDARSTPYYTPLQFDPELYREYVQDMDLSTEQQDALLQAVWLVMVGVIDIGLGTHGQADSNSKPLAVDSSSVLAFFSTSNIANVKDAKATGPNARRTDS